MEGADQRRVVSSSQTLALLLADYPRHDVACAGLPREREDIVEQAGAAGAARRAEEKGAKYAEGLQGGEVARGELVEHLLHRAERDARERLALGGGERRGERDPTRAQHAHARRHYDVTRPHHLASSQRKRDSRRPLRSRPIPGHSLDRRARADGQTRGEGLRDSPVPARDGVQPVPWEIFVRSEEPARPEREEGRGVSS
jgi:hypothetical protein